MMELLVRPVRKGSRVLQARRDLRVIRGPLASPVLLARKEKPDQSAPQAQRVPRVRRVSTGLRAPQDRKDSKDRQA